MCKKEACVEDYPYALKLCIHTSQGHTSGEGGEAQNIWRKIDLKGWCHLQGLASDSVRKSESDATDLSPFSFTFEKYNGRIQ